MPGGSRPPGPIGFQLNRRLDVVRLAGLQTRNLHRRQANKPTKTVPRLHAKFMPKRRCQYSSRSGGGSLRNRRGWPEEQPTEASFRGAAFVFGPKEVPPVETLANGVHGQD